MEIRLRELNMSQEDSIEWKELLTMSKVGWA